MSIYVTSKKKIPVGYEKDKFTYELYFFFNYVVHKKNKKQKDVAREISTSEASLSKFMNGVLGQRGNPVQDIIKKSFSYFQNHNSLLGIEISRELKDAIHSDSTFNCIKNETRIEKKIENIDEKEIEKPVEIETGEIVNVIDNSKEYFEKIEYILKNIESLTIALSDMKSELMSLQIKKEVNK